MKKFQFANDHLIEIFRMFTEPNMVENLRRLSKHSHEMQKYRMKPTAADTKNTEKVQATTKKLASQQHELFEKKVKERFVKMKEEEFLVAPDLVDNVTDELLGKQQYGHQVQADMLPVETSDQFVERLNKIINKQSEQAYVHNPDRLNLSDCLIYEDNRLQVDLVKFSVYLFDNRDTLEECLDDNKLKTFEELENTNENTPLNQFKYFFKSLVHVNKFLSGELNPNYPLSQSVLAAINKSRKKKRQEPLPQEKPGAQ